MKNDYYVYIYWRLDTNEPFYVGKGKNDRWKQIDKHQRNIYFMRIINKHPIACEIVKDNLTEDEAHGIECWLINELVFEYGFSIEIKDNRSNKKEKHLVNMTWGGEGVSGLNSWENMTEETRIKRSEKISNSNKDRKMSEETKRKISENHTDVRGENNPMYGKDWREGKTEEEILEIKKRQFNNTPKGENHPMFGVKRPKEIINKIKNTKIEKGTSNERKVICVTTVKIFNSIIKASIFYDCDRSSITNCCKGYKIRKGKRIKVQSAGKLPDGTKLIWMYLEEFLSKCEYTEL